MTVEQWLLFLGLALGSGFVPAIISGISGWRKARADATKAEAEGKSIVEQVDELVWKRSAATIGAMQDEIKGLRDRLQAFEGVTEENRQLRRDIERLEPLMKIVAELTENNEQLSVENKRLKKELTAAQRTIEELRQRVAHLEARADQQDSGG